ncbi:MAG: stage II sporulation protein M [Bacilli bacterium]
MKKGINQLKQYLTVNKSYFVFLSILLIIGIFAGSIFFLTLNEGDTSLVSEYLSDYIESVSSNSINFKVSLFNSILSNTLLSVVIFLLGFSVIGLPITLLLFFYKSFIIGFSISSIILNYKLKGLILSIFYVFPHQVCSVILYMILVMSSLIISLNLIKAILNKKEISFKDITSTYTTKYLIILFCLCLFSIYESIILPKVVFLLFKIFML